MQTVTESPTEVQSDRSKAIQSYASRMAARHPQYAAMADKAAAIVEAGTIYALAETKVYVHSNGNEYTLEYNPGGWVCNCPAFYYRPAFVGNRAYCKHIVAMVIFQNVAEVQ